jgi:hypothetical protein
LEDGSEGQERDNNVGPTETPTHQGLAILLCLGLDPGPLGCYLSSENRDLRKKHLSAGIFQPESQSQTDTLRN